MKQFQAETQLQTLSKADISNSLLGQLWAQSWDLRYNLRARYFAQQIVQSCYLVPRNRLQTILDGETVRSQTLSGLTARAAEVGSEKQLIQVVHAARGIEMLELAIGSGGLGADGRHLKDKEYQGDIQLDSLALIAGPKLLLHAWNDRLVLLRGGVGHSFLLARNLASDDVLSCPLSEVPPENISNYIGTFFDHNHTFDIIIHSPDLEIILPLLLNFRIWQLHFTLYSTSDIFFGMEKYIPTPFVLQYAKELINVTMEGITIQNLDECINLQNICSIGNHYEAGFGRNFTKLRRLYSIRDKYGGQCLIQDLFVKNKLKYVYEKGGKHISGTILLKRNIENLTFLSAPGVRIDLNVYLGRYFYTMYNNYKKQYLRMQNTKIADQILKFEVISQTDMQQQYIQQNYTDIRLFVNENSDNYIKTKQSNNNHIKIDDQIHYEHINDVFLRLQCAVLYLPTFPGYIYLNLIFAWRFIDFISGTRVQKFSFNQIIDHIYAQSNQKFRAIEKLSTIAYRTSQKSLKDLIQFTKNFKTQIKVKINLMQFPFYNTNIEHNVKTLFLTNLYKMAQKQNLNTKFNIQKAISHICIKTEQEIQEEYNINMNDDIENIAQQILNYKIDFLDEFSRKIALSKHTYYSKYHLNINQYLNLDTILNYHLIRLLDQIECRITFINAQHGFNFVIIRKVNSNKVIKSILTYYNIDYIDSLFQSCCDGDVYDVIVKNYLHIRLPSLPKIKIRLLQYIGCDYQIILEHPEYLISLALHNTIIINISHCINIQNLYIAFSSHVDLNELQNLKIVHLRSNQYPIQPELLLQNLFSNNRLKYVHIEDNSVQYQYNEKVQIQLSYNIADLEYFYVETRRKQSIKLSVESEYPCNLRVFHVKSQKQSSLNFDLTENIIGEQSKINQLKQQLITPSKQQ